MNMTETANLIETLREIGFTDTQVADFQLAVEGRITKEEFKRRFEEDQK